MVEHISRAESKKVRKAERLAEKADVTEEEAVKPARPAVVLKPQHGQRYLEALTKVDQARSYPLAEALELVKAGGYTKFDGSVDVHVRLTPTKKAEEAVRGIVSLPHGTGKERRVVIITEELIAKIEQGWTDFDIAIATPALMPKLAKLAKILGPKGLMPNPKSGTVTPEPEKVAAELKGGRVEFKADTLGNVHQSIGRASWDSLKLTENFQTFMSALPKARIGTVTLAPTMGPGVSVSL